MRQWVEVSAQKTVCGLVEELLHRLTGTDSGILEAAILDQDALLPLHSVAITPFRLDTFPVTAVNVIDWLECSQAGKAEITRQRIDEIFQRLERLNSKHCPAVGLRLKEIELFAREHGGRLPTNIEWMCACRGEGKETVDVKNSSELIGELNWLVPPQSLPKDLLFGLTPVDSFPSGVSWCGCWDLLGNASEVTTKRSDGPGPLRYALFACSYAENFISPGLYKSFDRNEMDNNLGLSGFRLAYD